MIRVSGFDTAFSYDAIFEHPDTGCGYAIGNIIADDTNIRSVILELFRALWEEKGHYYHNMKLTITAYFTFEDEVVKSDYTVKGGWYDTDTDVLSTYERKIEKFPRGRA